MSDSPALILASGSPRRRELLARAGVRFDVRPADIPELARPGEAPRELVERLAHAKAEFVARQVGAAPARIVLGSDTVVVLGERVLGKPRDEDDAVRMLAELAGRTHRVLTGVAVVPSDTLSSRVLSVESRVTMRPADDDELRRYVESGEPLDKAGAYALQGEGRRFVDHVDGSETNVIGLPVEETLALLRGFGLGLEPGLEAGA